MKKQLLFLFDQRRGQPVYVMLAVVFLVMIPLLLAERNPFQTFLVVYGVYAVLLGGYILCWRLRLRVKRWWGLRQARRKGEETLIVW